MMVMTAKVDKKKIAIIFAAVVVAIAALVILLGGGKDASPTVSANVSNNDARVEFLKGFGWDVTTSPMESSQVRIPEKTNEVFDRYNQMQKQQGYDLSNTPAKPLCGMCIRSTITPVPLSRYMQHCWSIKTK